MKGYLILNGSFKFPANTKYPSIPCYIDKTTTVYPLQGKALISGPEYVLAKSQKCKFTFSSAFHIPATEIKKTVGFVDVSIPVQPFYKIIKDIQIKRREYPKGHFMNALYKELGNGIYGNVVRGISNKKSFDTKSGKMFRVSGTELSNPILASWTTAFIRSVIGECLHNISKVKGKVVSVTTDGFITDIPNLEERLLTLNDSEIPLLKLYKRLREALTDSCDSSQALELKNNGVGIIS